MKLTAKKAAKRKLNVRLLRKIQRHILEEPRRFLMSTFVVQGKPNSRVTGYKRCSDQAAVFSPCGTAACIAGWTNILTGAKPDEFSDLKRACQKLGITVDDRMCLFSAILWPEPFASRYGKATTPKQRVKIACARIDHFVENGE